MADQQPRTAADQLVQPRRHRRRRQRNASTGHLNSLLPEQACATADRRRAVQEDSLDGWTVTHDADTCPETSLWTADRRVFEQLRPAQSRQDYPTCLLCCESFKVVAFGKCSHKEICAECFLQMVMLYENSTCPLCKAELDQIVITQWAGPETGSWADWSSILHTLWHDYEWSDIFYIADTAFPGTSQPLHAHFQQLTATACSICDPQGNHPFQTDSALCKHMSRQHHRQLCRICLRARQRAFPLQQPTYTAAEVHAHVAADHPQCRHCGMRFYDGEQHELHMMEVHPYCELCDEDFPGTAEFTEHLRSAHWLCQEPVCQGCFVAFETKEELIHHQHTVHASGTPQQDVREQQIMAVNAFRAVVNDLIPEAAATLGSDAASAAASSLLRATLAAIRLFPSAHEGSSSMRLPPSLQPSEPSHHRSPLHPSPHPPASLLPSRSAQQQQHEAEEPGTFIAFAWGPFNSGNSQTAGGRGQSQLGLAGGPQAAAAAAAGPQHSRRLSQAEIDERMASRRVGVSHSRANPQGHAGAGSTFGTSNRCYHRQ